MSIPRWSFLKAPLGMNRRNELIREASSFRSLRLVKSKSQCKRILQEHGIATSRTFDEVHDFSDMPRLASFPDEFVVKPDGGFGGKGIILLKRQDGHFVDPAGHAYSSKDLRWHIRKILDGDFSGYIAHDIALIEERLYPSPKLQFKDAYGLSDIRVWCFQFQPVMAMLRYPTFKSRGRANLAAGGIGIGIDVATGRPTFIHTKGGLEFKPEGLGMPAAFVMPKWDEMKDIARQCSQIADLRITGVDLILDAGDQVRVLEVNGRPGLEIQNINEDSLLERVLRERWVAAEEGQARRSGEHEPRSLGATVKPSPIEPFPALFDTARGAPLNAPQGVLWKEGTSEAPPSQSGPRD